MTEETKLKENNEKNKFLGVLHLHIIRFKPITLTQCVM